MQKRAKKITVIALTAAIVAGGGGAFAYWTLQGSGTSTAATGVVSGAISTVDEFVPTDLRPGGAPQELSGAFNNSDDSPVFVNTVTVSIDSVTPLQGKTCDATNYTIVGAEMPVGESVASGNPVGSWGGATIAFNNKADVNQDGCQGATVNLAYVIS